MNWPKTELNNKIKNIEQTFLRVSRFLIYILNNNLFAKSKELRYLRDTSHLFIDQIEGLIEKNQTFLQDLEDDKSNGILKRVRKPTRIFPARRK